jgi:hypothetical protein
LAALIAIPVSYFILHHIFTFSEDNALIAKYGSDFDIATDCVNVIPDHTTNNAITSPDIHTPAMPNQEKLTFCLIFLLTRD